MRVAMFIVLAMVLLASSQAPAAKKQHAVRPEELLTLIQHADKVVVYSLYREDRRIIYSSSSAADLDALRAEIQSSGLRDGSAARACHLLRLGSC
jgi:hypothetical protein